MKAAVKKSNNPYFTGNLFINIPFEESNYELESFSREEKDNFILALGSIAQLAFEKSGEDDFELSLKKDGSANVCYTACSNNNDDSKALRCWHIPGFKDKKEVKEVISRIDKTFHSNK